MFFWFAAKLKGNWQSYTETLNEFGKFDKWRQFLAGKRCDWWIGKIVVLIKSIDGKIRSAKFDVISKDKIMTLKRPINKLFPVEFSNQKNIKLNFVNEKNIPQVVVGGSVA